MYIFLAFSWLMYAAMAVAGVAMIFGVIKQWLVTAT